jgi:hypothetical protein
MLQGLVCRRDCGCARFVLVGAGDLVEHEIHNSFFADIADRFGIVDATDHRQPCNPMLKHGSSGDERRILEGDSEWVGDQKVGQFKSPCFSNGIREMRATN